MTKSARRLKTKLILLLAVLFAPCLSVALFVAPQVATAATGTCTAPSTDYGTVTESVSIPATGTYYVWSRMSADSSADSSYLLQIDTSNCFTVGTSSAKAVPVYANGATTYFSNDSTNWLDTTTTATTVSVSLTAGSHTIEMIGNAPNLVLDRVIFTQDSSCTPTGTGDNCANPVDTTPPVASITSPTAGSQVSGTVPITVSASDNVGVTGVDIYDGTTKLGSATMSSGTAASGVWTYNWSTSGLTAGGSHTLTAQVTDGTNVTTTSSVAVTIKDTTPPTVSITAPTNGTTQSGTISVTASASDNVGVTKVEFYVDGTLSATDTSSPYSTSVDTTKLTNASHTLTAKAYDAAGNVGTSSTVSITVSNTSGGGDTTPPTVSITAPANSAVLSNNLSTGSFNSSAYSVTASASDASGIQQVVFKLDGTAVATDTTAPYAYSLDLTKLSCGTHTLVAVATDNSTNHNVGTSSTITFTATYSADINNDCHVNYLDLSALASKYGQSSSLGRADVNMDGAVNYLDLSALASQYNKY